MSQDQNLDSNEETNVESGIETRLVGFEDVPPIYANDIRVSADTMGLQLVFTRYFPPPIDTDADRRKVMEQGVPVEVVARVIVPALLAEQMLGIVADRLEAHREMERAYREYMRSSSSGDIGEESGQVFE